MQFNLFLLTLLFQIALGFSASAQSTDKLASAEPYTREVSVTGFTRAKATIPLTTEVAGKIENIFADTGEPIPESGQYACLDMTFVQFDLQSIENEIAQHSNDINYFKKETARYKKLTEKQTAAVSALDKLTRDLANAQIARQAAQIRKQRLVELKQRHCISAPEGWLVTDRTIEPGQWVNVGEVLGFAGDYSQLIIPLTLSEQEIAALKKKEKKFNIFFPEFNLKVPAQIKHISPAFDEKTRKTLIELIMKDGLPSYRGGMRVLLNLDLPTASQSFEITQKALEKRFEEYWLTRNNGKSIRVNLLNETKDGKVRITSSEIKAGDQFKISHK